MTPLMTQVPPWNEPLPPCSPSQPVPPCEFQLNPEPKPSVLDEVGGEVGQTVGDWASSAFEAAMGSLWSAALAVFKETVLLADRFSVFTVSTTSGPVGALWPMMVWISGALALGLFFWQLALTAVRGGKGFLRLVIGPAQYGVALAVTVGMVAAMLAAADGLSTGILTWGLQASTFEDAVTNDGGEFFFDWADATSDAIKVLLGLLGLLLLLPAGICLTLELLFREAAIYVLIATVPISAAGLLAGSTSRWYWTTTRWFIALVGVKPALSLVLVIGVTTVAEAQGLSGLVAGVAVLPIAVACPLVLFKLLSFVDPNTDAGAGLRNTISSTGLPTYGDELPTPNRGSAGGSGGGGAQETATDQRFDDAFGNTDTGDFGGGFSADDVADDDSFTRPDDDDDSGGGAHGGMDPPPEPPVPDDGGPGGGSGPSGGSGSGGDSDRDRVAAAAEEAAVAAL